MDIIEYKTVNNNSDVSRLLNRQSVYFEIIDPLRPRHHYFAVKFSNKQITDQAQKAKIYGMLMKKQVPIKFQFDKIIEEEFASLNSRQYYHCVTSLLETQIDFDYLKKVDIIKDYFPLHQTRIFNEIRACMAKFRLKIIWNTINFMGHKHDYTL